MATLVMLFISGNIVNPTFHKAHVTLPREFIDHVMSEEGAAFIERFIDQSDSWSNAIKKWKKRQGFKCFLPGNAGEIELEDF